MSSKKRKISNIIVDRNFQGKLVALFLIFGTFQAFVTYMAVYYSFKEIKAAVNGEDVAIGYIRDLLMSQEYHVLSFIGFAFLISFMVCVFTGLRFTHQAAGAIYRFRTEFEKMKEHGELYPVTLRKDDFFKDVEVAFNEMVESVHNKGASKKSD